MKTSFKLLLTLMLFFVCANQSIAQIRLPKIIGGNMVLQRNQALPIWGWAVPGKQVTVKFSGQLKSVVAGTDGYWKVLLNPLAANDKPQNMVIKSDTSTVTLNNILIGEVWLGGGQSNMEYVMKRHSGYTKPAKGIDSAELELSVHNPQIRLFLVEKKLSLPDVTTKYGWHEAEGVALEEFSAPGYYFAKQLYNALHVPIGIIASSWGGSRIEPWTPFSAYAALPAFKNDIAAKADTLDGSVVGNFYKSMIEPLAPFAMHGFIWYQGESNCMINEPGMRYADKMQALINSWRKVWGSPKMSFYSVLIAPYLYTKRKDHVPHTAETLPDFWEQQQASVAIPYTEAISVTDLVDDPGNIHPSYKWEVGRRLALVALAKDYGIKRITYSGPRYKTMQVNGSKAVINFIYADGLKTSDSQPVNNFDIAGEDGVFFPATAEIKGNTVVLFNPDVKKPVTVRFAWAETAEPNLVNSAGFPAFPFRTNAKKWDYVK